ncbi:MAG: coiled-coil protein [Nitrososphaeraceae archaeon]
MARDQHSNGSSNTAATAATTTAARNNNTRTQNLNSTDSNLKTLLDFKKSLLEEQKETDQRIQEINNKIESTKMQIDEERSQLEELRNKLKQINEQKDTEYTRFMELKKSLIEVRDEMKKTVDDKAGSSATSKSRRDRFDIANLSKNLEQIERDIQTKKLSKDEERKLVARSKEIATKLHGLKIIHKKEEHYRKISSQYDALKTKMNSIFDQKTEFGNKIGTLKASLDSLLNLREELYEERRKEIHGIREIAAKLEMVETQLNAIEFRRSRIQYSEHRQRRQKETDERRTSRYEVSQERTKRNKENQERWNTLKEVALKKMSNGEKLTFDEMKLIFGDSGPE